MSWDKWNHARFILNGFPVLEVSFLFERGFYFDFEINPNGYFLTDSCLRTVVATVRYIFTTQICCQYIHGNGWRISCINRLDCGSENFITDVIMGAMASQFTSLTIVYPTVYSGADQRKHQSSALLAFVRGIHRWSMNSPLKWPVTRKCFHLMTSLWFQSCLCVLHS